MKKHGCIVCVAIASFVTSRACAQGGHDAATYIRSYAQAMKRYERLAAKCKARTYSKSEFDSEDGRIPPDRLVKTDAVDYWRDGDRVRIVLRRTDRAMLKGKIAERTESIERTVTPEGSISAPRDASGNRLQSGRGVRATSPTGDQELRLMLVDAISYTGSLFVFEGVIDALGPKLSEQMLTAGATAASDLVGNTKAVRLDFEDSWGIHSVWLDPTRDCLPLKMTQRKLDRHLLRPGFRLSQTSGPFGKRTVMDSEVVITGMQQVQGLWFVESFDVKSHQKTDKDKTVDVQTVVRVSDISLDPKASGNAFSIQTHVPDGSRVVVTDKRPIVHEWREGKVVKSENQAHADSLARQQFVGSSRWWVWTSAALVVMGCGYALFKWRQRAMAA